MPYLACKNHNRVRAVFLAAGFLFVMAGCSNGAADDAEDETAMQDESSASPLLDADEILHRRLQNVLDADSIYNQLVNGIAAPAALDEKSGQVIQAEIALRQTIDSLEQGATDPLLRLTGYFKKALQSRQALADLRMVLSADGDDSTATQQTMGLLRAELQAKNERITALEQANKTALQEGGISRNAVPNEPATNAPAKGETPTDLKQRNKNLSLALSGLQTKYFVLGRDYLVLKQQHERTVAELTALRKAGNQK